MKIYLILVQNQKYECLLALFLYLGHVATVVKICWTFCNLCLTLYRVGSYVRVLLEYEAYIRYATFTHLDNRQELKLQRRIKIGIYASCIDINQGYKMHYITMR